MLIDLLIFLKNDLLSFSGFLTKLFINKCFVNFTKQIYNKLYILITSFILIYFYSLLFI